MKTERETWEALTSEYIRKVERSLAQVDHPRKKEVLEDLRDHLERRYADMPTDERTPEKFDEAIAEMDAPEEYAELLAPATGAAPRNWFRRPLIRWLLAVIAVFILARCLFLPDNRTLGLQVRELCGFNYTATPFFSKRNFQRIQPGMTADQVRGLIGFPWHRYGVVGKENEAHWEYATGAVAGATFHRQFRVTLDRQSEKALKTETFQTNYPDGIPSANVLHAKRMREQIGTLHLQRADGSERVLRSSDGNLYLICQLSPGDSKITERLDYYVRSVKNEFGWLENEGVSVLYLVAGGYSEEDANLLKEEIAEIPHDVFVTSLPTIKMRDSRMLVYSRGVLFELPPIFSGECAAAWRADHQWLLRRLLQ
ncbi:MAG TPA: hypothetical protein VM492_03380 [Sumerlaeia bacterium]|nr:hypothetical protein [Sumerlaeia bacterium]